jgi:hypothetical protein
MVSVPDVVCKNNDMTTQQSNGQIEGRSMMVNPPIKNC